MPEFGQALQVLRNPEARERFFALPDRRLTMMLAAALAVTVVFALSLVLSGRAAQVVLDKPSPHFPYPLTIQNVMHVFFFLGLGELFVRWRVAAHEHRFVDERYLPEDESTVLQFADLGPVLRRVSGQFDREHGILPSLVNLCILQFQASRSVDQTVAVMNAHLELTQHRVDMRYSLIRYIAWFVPTLGFIGTVIGLGASLAEAGHAAQIDLKQVAGTLAVGFDCTMVALVESAVLVFLLHVVQEREEGALNRAGDYCLRNLINRLYAGEHR